MRPLDEWNVADDELPARASPPDVLAFLVRYAVLAPSGHNTQPWLYRVCGDHLDLFADRTRALPVVDPDDRELTLSCGAALYNLRAAARHFALTPSVQILPDPDDPDLLARMSVSDGERPSEEEETLFEAIPNRRTNRSRFEDRPLSGEVMAGLERAATGEGAWLDIVRQEARDAVVDLVSEGDHLQGSDPSFRRELAAWLHPNRTRSRDGMPGYGFGISDLASYAGPLVIRTFDWGDRQAAKDRELAAGSPALAVLGTEEDTPRAWMAAGQALEHVLLRAAADGLEVSYLNQPVELAELRRRLANRLGRGGYPQLVLRIGTGPAARPTPRRPPDEVMERA